jgi:hypothetical protein
MDRYRKCFRRAALNLFAPWQRIRFAPFARRQAVRERSYAEADVAGYVVSGIRAAAAILAAIVVRYAFAAAVGAVFEHDAATAPSALILHPAPVHPHLLSRAGAAPSGGPLRDPPSYAWRDYERRILVGIINQPQSNGLGVAVNFNWRCRKARVIQKADYKNPDSSPAV